MADARARAFTCLLVRKPDRFGPSLVDCLNDIKNLEDQGIRLIAVIQGLDTGIRNPASRFLLHVLGSAAEFEGCLIRERTQSVKNMPMGRLSFLFCGGRIGSCV